MDNDPGTIKEMHEEEGREKIKKLQKKIDITKYNMEVSSEILSETPSDTQKEKLIEKIGGASTGSRAWKRKFATLKRCWRNKNRESGVTLVPPLFCGYLSLPGLCLLADCFLWLRLSPSLAL